MAENGLASTRSILARASDGCHKYGWLINLVVMGLMFAYFVGGMRAEVTDLKQQMQALQSQVYELVLKVR